MIVFIRFTRYCNSSITQFGDKPENVSLSLVATVFDPPLVSHPLGFVIYDVSTISFDSNKDWIQAELGVPHSRI